MSELSIVVMEDASQPIIRVKKRRMYTATELREIFSPDDSSIVLALLDKAEALTARCETLEAALLKYGYHHESCDFVQSELPCTCGLEVLRSSVADGERHE